MKRFPVCILLIVGLAVIAAAPVAAAAPAADDLPPCCQPGSETALASSAAPAVVDATDPDGNHEPGIDEKLGGILPLETPFTDETGAVRPLKTWLGKPTLLAFVYFRCPGMCNLIQGSVADAVKKLTLKPGADFNIISISMDEFDTPARAVEKKREFLNLLGPDFPASAWTYLCGTRENIRTVTRAAGFYFKRIDQVILHPGTLIVLSPDGKIVRYLHGTSFLPMNVALALTEAAEGRVGISARSVVTFCFTYDPVAKKYVLNILRLSGSVVLVLGGLLMFLILRRPDTNSEKGQHGIETPKLS